MLAEDGKMRMTDVADTEQLFCLLQSVPSKKAEPFKLWLAKVGRERIDEIEDPEIGIDRLMETYLKKDYSKEGINQRLKSIEVRKDLTNEWDKQNLKKGRKYAILTQTYKHHGYQPIIVPKDTIDKRKEFSLTQLK